jgi:serine/threonine protein kinase
MHRRELVHGTVSPACIYQDGEQLRLADLWFAHNADGDALYSELSSYFPAQPPEYALPFMSPEVLLGYPPKRESDIFSLGAVLFYLLTGEAPRDLPPPYADEATREALAEAPVKTLAKLRPDLSGELGGLILNMLTIDPGERPSIFLLEGICAELVGGSASDEKELEETAL